MINVLLVEDHHIVREGIEQLLKKTAGLRVVGSTATGEEGLAIARKKQPHVIILDFQLPDSNGLELTRKLLRYQPDLKILIMSASKNETLSLQVLEAGAAGYLSKEQGYRELDLAIRRVHQGQRYLSSDIASQLALRSVEPEKATPFDTLSGREMEIALLVAEGLSPENIANRLHIAKKTVHSYRYRLFAKLNVKNDLELLRLALRSGIVELEKENQ